MQEETGVNYLLEEDHVEAYRENEEIYYSRRTHNPVVIYNQDTFLDQTNLRKANHGLTELEWANNSIIKVKTLLTLLKE